MVYDFFQALIDEDRLLSRLEVLENQLHVYSKVRLLIFNFNGTVTNLIALRMAKTLWSFGQFECNRVHTVTCLEQQSRWTVLSVLSLFNIGCSEPGSFFLQQQHHLCTGVYN